MPPWAFTSLAHSSYPRLNAWPSAEKSPVRDSDAPMVIGPVGLAVEVGVLAGLPALVQAARALSPVTVMAAMANAFPENQGWPGLTPSSSFRFRTRPGRSLRPHLRWLYRPERLGTGECGEIS